jgi:hypothetical protein
LQRLVQPPQQIGRKVHIGGLREDPAKLARELKLTAASPAPRQVLLDQGSVGLVDGAVEILQLRDRVEISNLRYPPRAMTISTTPS